MKIEKKVVVQASPEKVWDTLWDVERVAGCIPGCSDVRVIEPQKSYSAVVSEKVGPFKVRFPVAVTVAELQAPTHMRVDATGRDAAVASTLKASLSLDLASQPVDRTEIAIDVDLTVLGKLGTLGGSVIKRKADENMALFGQNLAREIQKTAA